MLAPEDEPKLKSDLLFVPSRDMADTKSTFEREGSEATVSDTAGAGIGQSFVLRT